MASKNVKYQPSCMMAHQFINKLTIIIGGCDLLRDEAEMAPVSLQRILAIREAAKSMADELTQHQCQLDATTRSELMTESVASV